MYQRPQHLLTRFARGGTVHFWEEPVVDEVDSPQLHRAETTEGVVVLTPVLPGGLDEAQTAAAQRELLDAYIEERGMKNFCTWYYTPMALRFSGHVSPGVVVYDCMDELSGFQGAPAALVNEEKRLFERADVVFTGGASLYASKKAQHPNAHLFPSSIDYAHFAAARNGLEDPADQAAIPHPRIGFYGVLDERLDRDLLAAAAAARPEWHFILIGPVVKIREEDLPRGANLHYLGCKAYGELPAYLSNWDVATLPFARNNSTRFISPTKTPEYLAGGKPVVSTPIADVVTPYAELKLVHIGETAEEFVCAIERARDGADEDWLARVDAFLAENSWDKTFNGMWNELQRCQSRAPVRSAAERHDQEAAQCSTI